MASEVYGRADTSYGSSRADTSYAVDQEARALVAELQTVFATVKPGTAEREQREDRIYKRLNELAELIREQYPNDPNLQQFRYLVTDKGDAALRAPVNRLPIYTDEYKMFTQSPTNPKVQMFLKTMAKDTGSMPAESVDRVLADQYADGSKSVLRSMVTAPNRTQWLQNAADETCRPCWNSVMRRLFMMGIEMLTLELRQRTQQISVAARDGLFTPVDAKELGEHIGRIISKTDEMLDESQRSSLSKEDWIGLVEGVFRLMVGLINDLMSRYFQAIRFRRENQA